MNEHETWRMRKASDRIFGPVALATLRAWACDGRIAPDDEVSEDDGPWRRACNVPDLGMDWLLELPGGELFGPVPLAAFLDMLREGTIGPDLKVRRRDDTDFRRLGDVTDGGLPGPHPEPMTSAPSTDIAPAESPVAAGSPSVSPLSVSVPGLAISEDAIPVATEQASPAPAEVGADHSSSATDAKEDLGIAEPDSGTPPKPSSRISPPDEARMLSELQSALGVGRRFRVFDRLRPGRSG